MQRSYYVHVKLIEFLANGVQQLKPINLHLVTVILVMYVSKGRVNAILPDISQLLDWLGAKFQRLYPNVSRVKPLNGVNSSAARWNRVSEIQDGC